MRTNCSICKQKPAQKQATIFLNNKITGYYVVVVTHREEFLEIPACNQCSRKIAVENHFNKTGSAWIVAAIFGIIIGLLMIGIEVPSILSGDMSSLFHTPVLGVIFLVPSVYVIWRCFRARKQVKNFLQILGYHQKGRMGVKAF